MHSNIIGMPSFQNGLNHSFSSDSLCFMSKFVEGGHEM